MNATKMLDRMKMAAVAHMQQPSIDHLPDEDRLQIIVDRTNSLMLEMMHQHLDALTGTYQQREELINLIKHRLLPAEKPRGIFS